MKVDLYPPLKVFRCASRKAVTVMQRKNIVTRLGVHDVLMLKSVKFLKKTASTRRCKTIPKTNIHCFVRGIYMDFIDLPMSGEIIMDQNSPTGWIFDGQPVEGSLYVLIEELRFFVFKPYIIK